ncbi:hypothetical protein [Antarctobacter jejuensis]|uniref:hypothetical protein n=1 Tax=Antarctobacter jejuensis TaxID=1439938 RepID=UPI003FD2017E
MDNEHEELLRKLSYQVSILGQTIDYDKYPVESLIISFDWGRNDLDKAHDIFEKWQRKIEGGGHMSNTLFEADFERELGITYQGLKSIILAFYRNEQWTDVCESYVDSFGKSPSVELLEVKRRRR